jgi:hypothetical protein
LIHREFYIHAASLLGTEMEPTTLFAAATVLVTTGESAT